MVPGGLVQKQKLGVSSGLEHWENPGSNGPGWVRGRRGQHRLGHEGCSGGQGEKPMIIV
jgi:hypothetical protein